MRNIIGSKVLTKSSENEEIVPNKPNNWSVDLKFLEFSFMNSQDCHIILNGNSRLGNEENKIFLRANQGLNIDKDDVDVESFVIIESGIDYNWVGKY